MCRSICEQREPSPGPCHDLVAWRVADNIPEEMLFSIEDYGGGGQAMPDSPRGSNSSSTTLASSGTLVDMERDEFIDEDEDDMVDEEEYMYGDIRTDSLGSGEPGRECMAEEDALERSSSCTWREAISFRQYRRYGPFRRTD